MLFAFNGRATRNFLASVPGAPLENLYMCAFGVSA